MEYTANATQGRGDKLGVVIYTQTHKIFGTIHIIPGSRLVDFFNAKAEDLFIVVTDATVYTLPNEQLLQAAEFFVINKTTITMVFPKLPDIPIISGRQSKGTTP